MCQTWSLSRVHARPRWPAGGTAPASGRRATRPASSSAGRRSTIPLGQLLPRSRDARAAPPTSMPRAAAVLERADRLAQRRRAPQRRPPRTAGAAVPAPWPTTASARSRGRPSRSRARPRSPLRSSAARTGRRNSRFQRRRRRRTAGRCGCRRCRRSPSVTPNRSRAAVLVPADDRRRPASPCASPRRRPAARPGCGSRRTPRRDARAGPARCVVSHGRHRRRQVDQPLRVGGEPAHHLQRRGGVLLADRDVAVQPRRDDPLAEHVLDVEQVVVRLLRA